MEIYHLFNPHTVLDPTMGWGGRLVGACVLDVPKYIGIDLISKQVKRYQYSILLLIQSSLQKI